MLVLGRPNRHHIIDASITPDNHIARPRKSPTSTSRTRRASLDGHEFTKLKSVDEPEQSVFHRIEDIVASVRRLRDDKNGGW